MRAHKQGRLVLFVGAGVSSPAPSCLPSFDELADRVAQQVGALHEDCSLSAEQRLEALAGRGINVRALVHEAVGESHDHNSTHKAVAALAVAGPHVRIVTTNYDLHLSTCLPDTTQVGEAPNLPAGDGFVGVVHLHGSLRQESRCLVVTESDFADAYLRPNSETLVFLQRLLASQTVLFIGYSIQDTLITYLLKAMRGQADLYALTRTPNSSHHADLGVTVVGYDDHDDLPQLLNQWAQRADATFADHDDWVARIVSSHASHGDLAPEDDSYLCEVVADPEFVRIFTKHARGPKWLRWAVARIGSKLFTPSGKLEPAEKDLLFWFAWHHNDDEQTAAEALRLIVDNGVRLHETLWLNMVMAPNPRGGASSNTASELFLVLAEAAPVQMDHCLLGLLRHCEIPRDDDLFLELVDRCFRPKVGTHNAVNPLRGDLGPFSARGNDPSNDWLRDSPDRTFWLNRRHLASELLVIVDSHLRSLHRIEAIGGDPDPFSARAAIEDHSQNLVVNAADFLVDAARDLWLVLLEDLPQVAQGYLESWAASRWTVFNRLAIHGWGLRSDVGGDDKLRWLLGQEGWVLDLGLHHETMRLIAEAVPEASEDTIEALVARITSEHEPRYPRIVYNKIGWIARHAPSSTAAHQALESARRTDLGVEMSEHPDFLWWVEDIAGTSSQRYLDGMEPPDLARDLIAEPVTAIARLLSVAGHDAPLDPMPYEWSLVLGAIQQATVLSPGAGLALLGALTQDPDANPEAARSAASTALWALVTPPGVQGLTTHQFETFGALRESLWRVGSSRWGLSPRPARTHGWLHKANNSWPGCLARLCVHKIRHQMQAAGETWAGLPEDDKQFFEAVISEDSYQASLARCSWANSLEFLHGADRAWAARHILSMLDPAADHQRAVQCWDAYLCTPRWTPQLCEGGLLEHLLAFAQDVDACCQIAQRGYARLAAAMCLASDGTNASGAPSWLTALTAKASNTTRVAFIRAVAAHLSDADSDTRAAQWRKWMRAHWQNRIRGVPRDLSEEEKSALADWAPLLDDDFPEAVDLALQLPTSLQKDSLQAVHMIDLTTGDGHLADLIDQHPQSLAQLIAHLLRHSNLQTAEHCSIPMTDISRELKHRLDEETFAPVREQLLRHGWSDTVP